MLQLLAFTHKNIIATRANDVLGYNDYEKIHPLIHNIINTGKKVRWYFKMDDNSISKNTGFWEDGSIEMSYGSMNFTHTEDIERIAIVGTEKWIKYMYSMMKCFTKARLMYFDLPDKEDGMKWITEQEDKELSSI